MAWNISILTIPGTPDQVEGIIPDIFYKSKENIHFEEASSFSIGNGLCCGYKDNKIIIIDVAGRFLKNEKFPVDISAMHNECKVFYISEQPVYRHYESGNRTMNLSGKEQVTKRLAELSITPIDEWGETVILQLFDYETFGIKRTTHGMLIWDVRFDLYELD